MLGDKADPEAFNTSIENELAYIYYAAEYSGYGKAVSAGKRSVWQLWHKECR